MCSPSSAFAHPTQSAQLPPSCPGTSQCIAAGGMAANPAHTLQVVSAKHAEAAALNDVPEPGTLALMGIGAIGVGYISRRYGARKA